MHSFILDWLYLHLGMATSGRPAPWNAFWSGFGSDITEVSAFLLGGYGLYRKNNCHEPRCPRIGRHAVDGTPWCDRHHHEARKVVRNAGHSTPPDSVRD